MFVCTFLKYERGAAVLRCVNTNAVLRCTAQCALDKLAKDARLEVTPVRWDRSAQAVECTVSEAGPPLKRCRE